MGHHLITQLFVQNIQFFDSGPWTMEPNPSFTRQSLTGSIYKPARASVFVYGAWPEMYI